MLAGKQVSYYPFVEDAPEESTFMVWDSDTGELIGQYRPEEYTPAHEDAYEDEADEPAALAWMTDSQIITASYAASLAVIDLEHEEITMLEDQPARRGEGVVGSLTNGIDRMGDMQLMDWRADDNLLIFGAAFFLMSNEDEINIWNLNQGLLVAKLIGHTTIVTSVEWHPSENLLASGSMDETMRIWDTANYTEIASFPHDDFVASIAWNSQGNRLASITENGTVYLWDVSIQDE
jgi:WD40 repeat protein